MSCSDQLSLIKHQSLELTNRIPVLHVNSRVYFYPQTGSTALFFASQQGHHDVVKLLFEFGASTELRTKVRRNHVGKNARRQFSQLPRIRPGVFCVLHFEITRNFHVAFSCFANRTVAQPSPLPRNTDTRQWWTSC